MASESAVDASRTVVQTYVPAYQRDEWDEHADQLDMSRSEFVKTMVQAGRRHFGEQPAISEDETDADDGIGDDLADQVENALDNRGACSWEELLAAVTDDIEGRLEGTLQQLQESDQIRYSGRDGGYVLIEES